MLRTRGRPIRGAAARTHTDASTDRIQCGALPALANLAAGTCAAWVFPTSVANAYRACISKQSGGGWEWYRRGVLGTALQFQLNRATQNYVFRTADGTLTANAWQLMVVTWDINATANSRWYRATLTTPPVDVTNVGAIQAGTGAQTDDSAVQYTLFASAGGAANSGWPGAIAAAGVWSRWMSAADVARLYRVPWSRLAPVALHTPGDEGPAGTLVPDWSGNGGHGVYTATTGFASLEGAPVGLFPATPRWGR